MPRYEIIQTCYVGSVLREPGEIVELNEPVSARVARPLDPPAAPAVKTSPKKGKSSEDAEQLL